MNTRVEGLEDRRVLTFTGTVSLGGAVVMTGTAGSDPLILSVAGTKLAHDNVGGGYNSTTDFDSAVPGDQTIEISDVTSLTINGAGGDDQITLQSLTLTNATLVDINGGGDNDTVALNSLTLGGAAATLNVASQNIQLNGAVSTTGTQQYDGAVSILANVNLTGTTVTFSGTVNGGTISSLAVTGNAVFGNDATDTVTDLTTLAVTGTTNIYASSVASSGTQTYTQGVTVGADTTLTTTDSAVLFSSTLKLDGDLNVDSGTGAVTFTGTVEGPKALTVTSPGDTTFLSTVGSTTPLASVTTTGNTLINGGVVKTSGAQTYNGSVTIDVADATLTAADSDVYFGQALTLKRDLLVASGTGAITFDGTVNGPFDLIVNSTGVTTFNGAVDAVLNQALTSLSVNGGGSTVINGGLITTAGLQNYGGAVSVATAAATLTTGGNTLTIGGALQLAEDLTVEAGVGAVTFTGTVNGPYNLLVNSTGTTTFTGAVGTDIGGALASLAIHADGTTLINGGTVNTTGSQTYGKAVTVGAVSTNLTTDGGALLFGGTVQLNVALTASAGVGTVTFGGAVDGAYDLTVNSDTLITFSGPVGTSSILNSVLTNGATTINGGAVKTTGTQTYNGDVTVDVADVTLTTANSNVIIGQDVPTSQALLLKKNLVVDSGSGAVTFRGKVDGDNELTINSTGDVTFQGTIGTTSPVKKLTHNLGGGTTIGGPITTSGDQIYGGTVTLSAATTIAATAGAVRFNGMIAGAGYNLNIEAGAGGVVFGDAAGDTVDGLAVLDIVGATVINTNSIKSTGAQAYHGKVTVGTNTVLTTIGGAVGFDQELVMNGNLTVSSGAGDVTFSGKVDGANNLLVTSSGVTTFSAAVGSQAGGALASVTTNGGGSTAINANVTTTGTQAYSEAATIGGTGVVLTTTDATVSFGGALRLNADLTISSGSGAVTFSGKVDGANDLLVTSSADTTFSAEVGSQVGDALASVIVNGTGKTVINGGVVKTTGNQSYFGDVITGVADTTITTASGAVEFKQKLNLGKDLIVKSDSGAVTFTGAVNGAHALIVNTPGKTTFSGTVGATDILTSVTTGDGGVTAINGGVVATTAAQTYGDQVTLGADTALTASKIDFNSKVDTVGAVTGQGDLTLNVTGKTTFGGTVGKSSDSSGLGSGVGPAITVTHGNVDFKDDADLRGSLLINVGTTGDAVVVDGATKTISLVATASAAAPVISIQDSNAVTVQNLTVQNIRGGDGISASHVAGALALKSITASSNSGAGFIGDHLAGASIESSTFNQNAVGISVSNVSGLLKLTSVTASSNTGDGLNGTTLAGVDISSSTFDENDDDGISVTGVSGALKLASVSASSNSDDGFNGFTLAGVDISSSTFNGNGDDGIWVKSVSGALTLATVTASLNSGEGFIGSTLAGVGITSSTFDDNTDNGISVTNVSGALNLTSVTASSNAKVGLTGTTVTGVTISSSTFEENDDGGIVLATVSQNVTITGTSAKFNDADGDNSGDGASISGLNGILTVSTSHFDGDDATAGKHQWNGLKVVNAQAVNSKVSGSTFSSNSNNGISFINVSNVAIGGVTAGEVNTVANNYLDGIRIEALNGGTSEYNKIVGNNIFDNGHGTGENQIGIGINLVSPDDTQLATGMTKNDKFKDGVPVGDSDDGVNGLQNYPEISYIYVDGGNLHVVYSVPTFSSDSNSASKDLSIQFYVANDLSNLNNSRDDWREGRIWLGDLGIKYSMGNEGASVNQPIPLSSLPQSVRNSLASANLLTTSPVRIVATATTFDGNTSEFSRAAAVNAKPGINTTDNVTYNVPQPNLNLTQDELAETGFLFAPGPKVPVTGEVPALEFHWSTDGESSEDILNQNPAAYSNDEFGLYYFDTFSPVSVPDPDHPGQFKTQYVGNVGNGTFTRDAAGWSAYLNAISTQQGADPLNQVMRNKIALTLRESIPATSSVTELKLKVSTFEDMTTTQLEAILRGQNSVGLNNTQTFLLISQEEMAVQQSDITVEVDSSPNPNPVPGVVKRFLVTLKVSRGQNGTSVAAHETDGGALEGYTLIVRGTSTMPANNNQVGNKIGFYLIANGSLQEQLTTDGNAANAAQLMYSDTAQAFFSFSGANQDYKNHFRTMLTDDGKGFLKIYWSDAPNLGTYGSGNGDGGSNGPSRGIKDAVITVVDPFVQPLNGSGSRSEFVDSIKYPMPGDPTTPDPTDPETKQSFGLTLGTATWVDGKGSSNGTVSRTDTSQAVTITLTHTGSTSIVVDGQTFGPGVAATITLEAGVASKTFKVVSITKATTVKASAEGFNDKSKTVQPPKGHPPRIKRVKPPKPPKPPKTPRPPKPPKPPKTPRHPRNP